MNNRWYSDQHQKTVLPIKKFWSKQDPFSPQRMRARDIQGRQICFLDAGSQRGWLSYWRPLNKCAAELVLVPNFLVVFFLTWLILNVVWDPPASEQLGSLSKLRWLGFTLTRLIPNGVTWGLGVGILISFLEYALTKAGWAGESLSWVKLPWCSHLPPHVPLHTKF